MSQRGQEGGVASPPICSSLSERHADEVAFCSMAHIHLCVIMFPLQLLLKCNIITFSHVNYIH